MLEARSREDAAADLRLASAVWAGVVGPMVGNEGYREAEEWRRAVKDEL
jgi:hypothetical protein